MASKYEQWFLKSQCQQDLNEMQSNSKIQQFSSKNVVQKMLCEYLKSEKYTVAYGDGVE